MWSYTFLPNPRDNPTLHLDHTGHLRASAPTRAGTWAKPSSRLLVMPPPPYPLLPVPLSLFCFCFCLFAGVGTSFGRGSSSCCTRSDTSSQSSSWCICPSLSSWRTWCRDTCPLCHCSSRRSHCRTERSHRSGRRNDPMRTCSGQKCSFPTHYRCAICPGS